MQVISPVNVDERKKADFGPGDSVRVHLKIIEKGKERTQVFEGLVLYRSHGTEAGATFTVRKTASGVGVEKTFPLYSPKIAKIEVVARGKARRAKLFYIRDKATKEARKKIRAERLAAAVAVADETQKIESTESDETKAETEVEVEEVKEKTENKPDKAKSVEGGSPDASEEASREEKKEEEVEKD